eukprot:GHVR01015601.1.p1 GENE.GHVR01015601.1~~GHVR01015601.1.p1  ORF type:complete len:174 (-),score=53.18 GHVR01015601.1:425-946(-)
MMCLCSHIVTPNLPRRATQTNIYTHTQRHNIHTHTTHTTHTLSHTKHRTHTENTQQYTVHTTVHRHTYTHTHAKYPNLAHQTSHTVFHNVPPHTQTHIHQGYIHKRQTSNHTKSVCVCVCHVHRVSYISASVATGICLCNRYIRFFFIFSQGGVHGEVNMAGGEVHCKGGRCK